MNTVALVKFKDSVSQALQDGLDLIGGFGDLESPVLVKPNICTISDDTGYSVTRVETVSALIELMLKTDEKLSIKIIESDSQSKFAEEAFRKFGYSQLCDDMQESGFDVGTVDLSKAPMTKLQFNGDYFETPELPEILLNAGYFVSVAVAKTHYLSFITGVLKNLFGVLPRKDQAFYHSKINEVIVDLARIIKPNLNIVDARVGVEGWNGPETRKLDAFIVGRGAVSVDSTMARIMGFEPEQVRHIMDTLNYDLGTITPSVLGESIESMAVKFNVSKK
ncbi:MAG: DUF362 domain-containing protein [Candidatus Thorarchaeota archaeon]|nr:DUF362 domain-containing protein [Candidatus Thorarchaeota archaeon]